MAPSDVSPTPRPWTLAQVAALLGTAAPGVDAGPIHGATHHSGRVRPGDLFFALPGAAGHGIEHADAALEAGAAWVVSDRPHPRGLHVRDPGAALLRLGGWARARLRGPVVAVTGSAGKTTAKGLLAAALDADASEGNLNTPHALAGRLIRAHADGRRRPLVLELGIDRPGEMADLAVLVRPDLALLTVIGPSHLDALGDRAGVAREKSVLLRAAPRAFAAARTWPDLAADLAERTVPYALSDAATAPEGTAAAEFVGRLGGEPLAPVLELLRPTVLQVPLPCLGRGAAESAVGALAVAEALGRALPDAAGRLAQATLEEGRLTVRRAGGRTVIDDAYNANPASVPDALATLRAGPAPRLALLGDMRELGVESARHHRALGEATRDLDRVLFVGTEGAAVRAGNPAVELVSADEAASVLERLPHAGTVLVKASRSLGFERFVRQLTRPEVAR